MKRMSDFNDILAEALEKQKREEQRMKIGDQVFVHGYVDEIRKDAVIIRNNGGYFGTTEDEVMPAETTQIEHRWIPVKEKVPSLGEYVLVTFGNQIAVCMCMDEYGSLREVTSYIKRMEIWLYPEEDRGDAYGAWMPLPKPWRGEEDE